ncbi:MAG: phosphoglycerate kinase [Fimbriimonadaceae bacterium]
MTGKKSLLEANVDGKRVLVRCDFNVPIADGKITDDRRIRAAVPTIENLLARNAAVILVSHLGRPKGFDPKLTLAPVAERLSEILGRPVRLTPGVVDEETAHIVQSAKPGDVFLLENVRFHPEEEQNDEEFARRLAQFADIYVNDAFGTAHRAHASTEGVTHHLPAYSGFLMQKELDYLGSVFRDPKHPFVAILGGAKVKDKIPVIESLLPKVDHLLIGGGMAFTFIKAQGHEIGKSLLDETSLEFAERVLAENPDKIRIPLDFVVAPSIDDPQKAQICPADQIPLDQMGLDIGPETRSEYARIIESAGTVVWNGPMGVFEVPAFAEGTKAVALAMVKCSGTTIVGGGDSAAAVEIMDVADSLSHVSTGGGASLEFLEGKALPGVEALLDAN